jgi:hypothetical protein
MSDEDAYMALALNNAQGELHPLEVGLHALQSGLGVRDYAIQTGANERTILTRFNAAAVVKTADVGDLNTVCRYYSQLAEIHSAPRWLWHALVSEMLDKGYQTTSHYRRVVMPVPVLPLRRTSQQLLRSALNSLPSESDMPVAR